MSERIACMAMQSLIARGDKGAREIASEAYAIADAMISIKIERRLQCREQEKQRLAELRNKASASNKEKS